MAAGEGDGVGGGRLPPPAAEMQADAAHNPFILPTWQSLLDGAPQQPDESAHLSDFALSAQASAQLNTQLALLLRKQQAVAGGRGSLPHAPSLLEPLQYEHQRCISISPQGPLLHQPARVQKPAIGPPSQGEHALQPKPRMLEQVPELDGWDELQDADQGDVADDGGELQMGWAGSAADSPDAADVPVDADGAPPQPLSNQAEAALQARKRQRSDDLYLRRRIKQARTHTVGGPVAARPPVAPNSGGAGVSPGRGRGRGRGGQGAATGGRGRGRGRGRGGDGAASPVPCDTPLLQPQQQLGSVVDGSPHTGTPGSGGYVGSGATPSLHDQGSSGHEDDALEDSGGGDADGTTAAALAAAAPAGMLVARSVRARQQLQLAPQAAAAYAALTWGSASYGDDGSAGVPSLQGAAGPSTGAGDAMEGEGDEEAQQHNAPAAAAAIAAAGRAAELRGDVTVDDIDAGGEEDLPPPNRLISVVNTGGRLRTLTTVDITQLVPLPPNVVPVPLTSPDAPQQQEHGTPGLPNGPTTAGAAAAAQLPPQMQNVVAAAVSSAMLSKGAPLPAAAALKEAGAVARAGAAAAAGNATAAGGAGAVDGRGKARNRRLEYAKKVAATHVDLINPVIEGAMKQLTQQAKATWAQDIMAGLDSDDDMPPPPAAKPLAQQQSQQPLQQTPSWQQRPSAGGSQRRASQGAAVVDVDVAGAGAAADQRDRLEEDEEEEAWSEEEDMLDADQAAGGKRGVADSAGAGTAAGAPTSAQAGTSAGVSSGSKKQGTRGQRGGRQLRNKQAQGTEGGQQAGAAGHDAAGGVEVGLYAEVKRATRALARERNAGGGRGGRGQGAAASTRPVFAVQEKPVCKYYRLGRCNKGAECPFPHAGQPIKQLLSCRHFWRGACVQGDACPYSHTLTQAQQPCRDMVMQGECLLRDACPFSHAAVGREVADDLKSYWQDEAQRHEAWLARQGQGPQGQLAAPDSPEWGLPMTAGY